MVSPDGSGLGYLLASPRAGATLLGAILGSHSGILCPPEPWFLLQLLGLRDERLVVAAPHDHDLARQATREFMDDALLVAGARSFAETVYNACLRRDGKRFFIDKNGRYYHIAGYLRRLFPDALHIWLKRNPLDVIASYQSSWNVTVEQLFGPIPTPNSFDVTACFPILARHFESDQRTFVLKYEDLVARPGEIVPPLCAALGVRFEERMLDIFQNAALMTQYSASPFGDKKLHGESSIHTRSVGAWKTVLTPEQVSASLHVLGTAIFGALGYTDALAEALQFSGLGADQIALHGRLAEYEEALARYPHSISAAAVAHPDQWSVVSGQAAPLLLGAAMWRALDEKEEMLQLLAREADERLRLLRNADAARAAAQDALNEMRARLSSE